MVGEGQNSKVAAQVPTNRVPARFTSFGGQIVRPWRGSVTLSCNAVGEPTSCEWYTSSLEQVRTDSSSNIQILQSGEVVFLSLQPQDAGNYTCKVENSQGSDRLHYSLIVQGNTLDLEYSFYERVVNIKFNSLVRVAVPLSAPVLFVSSSTSTSILLHWMPGYNGGAPLTKYTLHYGTTHGTLEELQLSRRATSHELKVRIRTYIFQLPINFANFHLSASAYT